MTVAPVLFACDLDRTLIYSAAAFWLETADADAPPMIVTEHYRGAPISFMTRAAERLLLGLAHTTTFVPVTTRTVAQYQRVQLPGPVPRYAVATNGGTLLHNGNPDAAWRATIDGLMGSACAPLAEVQALLAAASSSAWTLRVANAEDVFVYAVVDRTIMPAAAVSDLTAACALLGWTVSVQGRKVYCVPAPVTKSAAVEEVRRRVGASTVLAAGDSLLDQGMLEAATIAFRPAHGELDDARFFSPNLTATSRRGVLAGEELLGLVASAVSGETPGLG